MCKDDNAEKKKVVVGDRKSFTNYNLISSETEIWKKFAAFVKTDNILTNSIYIPNDIVSMKVASSAQGFVREQTYFYSK